MAQKPVSAAYTPPLTLEDHSTLQHSAQKLFGILDKRDVGQGARLSEQFHRQNRRALSLIGCSSSHSFDGNLVTLNLYSGSSIGAVPLLSPRTGRAEFGLVVHPRFPWAGIGPMLADMGWRIVPRTLKMPNMRTSERRVPPWVLSAMIISRIKNLLDTLTRRFEMVSDLQSAPKGRVDWVNYSSKQMAHGRMLSVPCTFPDLRPDQSIRSAIRYTLERHQSSLGTQRGNGKFIHNLLDLCGSLLVRVSDVRSSAPAASAVQHWLRSSAMPSAALQEGLEAIEWTVEERGLAGLSDLEGLPWTMSMENFYEAWVERVFQEVARRTSCTLKIGRKQETMRPLVWESAYLGSQRSLRPDLYMQGDGLTVIIDAKYKRHWEELRTHSWNDFQQEMKEHHRNDLMQALAYANLSDTPKTVTCLAYPCSRQSWDDFELRNRRVHKAALSTGSRVVELWLAAVPMGVPASEIATHLTQEVIRTRD